MPAITAIAATNLINLRIAYRLAPWLQAGFMQDVRLMSSMSLSSGRLVWMRCIIAEYRPPFVQTD